jgi:light-regulated signal transduction histidine kinase (bacteriophytochrome)
MTSALGFQGNGISSAFGDKADMTIAVRNVSLTPKTIVRHASRPTIWQQVSFSHTAQSRAQLDKRLALRIGRATSASLQKCTTSGLFSVLAASMSFVKAATISSNGFYAAAKRIAETNGDEYEPTIAAATKNLGDKVQIRIRDSTGIPLEVKEKIFNPFFTTKPAGEGTGLGLSISHDIIVKQHGGSIEVDTQPGEFTEFRITLPLERA